ncbi:hypothetical protein KAU11_10225 [Candidatus Babeliales bacterium]|nr:hypothetical protein [Candidatus Babeliales bacterium]
MKIIVPVTAISLHDLLSDGQKDTMEWLKRFKKKVMLIQNEGISDIYYGTTASFTTSDQGVIIKSGTSMTVFAEAITHTFLVADTENSDVRVEFGEKSMLLSGTVTPMVDANNSTSTPLSATASFIGTATDVSEYNNVVIQLYSDQDSATDGMVFESSTDGTNWDKQDTFELTGGNNAREFQFACNAKYFRLNYTNGAVDQTEFRIQTLLKTSSVITSIHRIKDSISEDNSAQLMKTVLSGENPSGIFVNFQATTAGNFKVAVEEDDTMTAYVFHDMLVNGSDSNINYIGKEKKDGKWLIQQMDETSGIIMTYGNESNNGTYTTYTTAWAARESLVFTLLENLTNL